MEKKLKMGGYNYFKIFFPCKIEKNAINSGGQVQINLMWFFNYFNSFVEKSSTEVFFLLDSCHLPIATTWCHPCS